MLKNYFKNFPADLIDLSQAVVLVRLENNLLHTLKQNCVQQKPTLKTPLNEIDTSETSHLEKYCQLGLVLNCKVCACVDSGDDWTELVYPSLEKIGAKEVLREKLKNENKVVAKENISHDKAKDTRNRAILEENVATLVLHLFDNYHRQVINHDQSLASLDNLLNEYIHLEETLNILQRAHTFQKSINLEAEKANLQKLVALQKNTIISYYYTLVLQKYLPRRATSFEHLQEDLHEENNIELDEILERLNKLEEPNCSLLAQELTKNLNEANLALEKTFLVNVQDLSLRTSLASIYQITANSKPASNDTIEKNGSKDESENSVTLTYELLEARKGFTVIKMPAGLALALWGKWEEDKIVLDPSLSVEIPAKEITNKLLHKLVQENQHPQLALKLISELEN